MAYNFISAQYTLSTIQSTVIQISEKTNGAIITELQATNKTSTSQSVQLAVNPSAGGAYYLYYGDIPPSSSIDLLTGKLVLLASDKILGASSVADKIDVVVGGVQF